ncbi:MAG: DUF4124 domain-containing protein [Steroidobacteraceae bacterium]
MLHFALNRFSIALLAQSAIAALLLSGGLARAGDTQVYKTVDEHGNIVYTDRPSSASAQKDTVHFHEPSAEDLARLEQQRKTTQAAESARVQQIAASSVARAQQEKAQKEKQARCDNARNYYDSLRDAARVYQLDDQGNRVYLPDADADAKRTEARESMEAACTS